MTKNLSPLGQSTYTINVTIDLNRKIKNEQIPLGFTIASSAIKSLFSSVQLTEAIDFILHRIYNRKELSVIKNEMKNMLTLYPKNVHFTLNNEIYVQNDRVAMGSSLRPISANVCMVELENTLVPRLHQRVKK